MKDNNFRPPHDRFFRQIFSKSPKAAELIKGTLPPMFVDSLELESLQLDSGSYVDDHLKESLADLVFRCPRRGEKGSVDIVFLLEHKSYVPEYPHFQILRYMVNFWERRIAEKKKPSVIVPIIVYHGTEIWTQAPLASKLEGTKDDYLSNFIPEFSYHLLNLRDERIEAIRDKYSDIVVQRGLIMLKLIFDESLFDFLPLIFSPTGKPQTDQSLKENFRIFAEYVLRNPIFKSPANMKRVKTIFDDWGYAKGSLHDILLTHGRREQLVEVANKMFQKGLTNEEIAFYLDASEEEVEQIRNGTFDPYNYPEQPEGSEKFRWEKD